MSPLNSGLGRSAFRGDSIVTDGLVCHLDAANINSYNPSFPTKWKHTYPAEDNSIVNASDVTYITSVFSGPPPPRTVYPSLSFNKNFGFVSQRTSSIIKTVNDIQASSNPVTVEIWCYIPINYYSVGNVGYLESPNYNNVNILFGWQSFKIVVFTELSSNVLYIGQSQGNNTIYESYRYIPNLVLGQTVGNTYNYTWRQIVCVMTSYPESYDSNKIYINGQKLTPLGSSSNVVYQKLSYNSYFVIGGYINTLNGATYAKPPSMDVAIVRIYDRELSLSEINKNFNTNRGRFEVGI
ncbi:MAG: hypothetical protein EBU90_25925 [Proteobacteria bacterium]|nr:hypothetical protein [Pseudomonadota bacterium]